MGKKLTCIVCALLVLVCAVETAILLGISRASPEVEPVPVAGAPVTPRSDPGEELAQLLVKLELTTRAVIGKHYTRSQSGIPGVDLIWKRWLAKNRILPAAVADAVFAKAVPEATGGRAWVKMVVDEPRNPNNRGDSTALEMLAELRTGAKTSWRKAGGAIYYAEPIVAKATCLPCHGEPAGAPDPVFPEYKKNGWKEGDIVGAVVARVAGR